MLFTQKTFPLSLGVALLFEAPFTALVRMKKTQYLEALSCIVLEVAPE